MTKENSMTERWYVVIAYEYGKRQVVVVAAPTASDAEEEVRLTLESRSHVRAWSGNPIEGFPDSRDAHRAASKLR